jgi:hypothetical protein
VFLPPKQDQKDIPYETIEGWYVKK